MAIHKLGPELEANIAALEELVEDLKTKSLAGKLAAGDEAKKLQNSHRHQRLENVRLGAKWTFVWMQLNGSKGPEVTDVRPPKVPRT